MQMRRRLCAAHLVERRDDADRALELPSARLYVDPARRLELLHAHELGDNNDGALHGDFHGRLADGALRCWVGNEHLLDVLARDCAHL
eukprot:scaffold103114_cov63-Phaeocystis_antarctica.AAC.4